MLTFVQKPRNPKPALVARFPKVDQALPGPVGAGSGRIPHDFSRTPLFARRSEAAQAVASPLFTHIPIGLGENGSTAAAPEAGPEATDSGPGATAAQDAGPAAEQTPAQPPQAETPETPQAEEQPAPEAACVINHRTAVHAPDGTPDTRTTVGVCETVVFDVGGQAVDWSASSGWPGARTGRASYEWAAPERAGTSTITATDPATGESCSLDMQVVAPTGVRLRNVFEINYSPGTAGAGMELTVGVRPRNVNFGWIAIREDSGPATRISGYFSSRTAAQLHHNATLDFRRMGWNNLLAPNVAGDPQGDTAATVSGTLPQPWSAGSFQWIIPTRYRCYNSTHNGQVFTNVQQRFTIQADGTVIVTKATERVERTP